MQRFCNKWSVLTLVFFSLLNTGCSTIARAVIAMDEEDVVVGKSSTRRSHSGSNAGGFFEDVKPWQKAKLARREMLFVPDDLQNESLDQAMGTREGYSGASCAGMGSFGCRK